MDNEATDVVAQAREVLEHSIYGDIRHLSIEHEGQQIVLHGSVGSFYHKQVAQELVRRAVNSFEIVNDAQVVYRHDWDTDWD